MFVVKNKNILHLTKLLQHFEKNYTCTKKHCRLYGRMFLFTLYLRFHNMANSYRPSNASLKMGKVSVRLKSTEANLSLCRK